MRLVAVLGGEGLGLLSAIAATGAQRVIVTHGDEGALVRYLSESGLQAEAFATEYGDETHGVEAAE
jgi:putative mRNA 3-end processing factor